MGEDRPSRRRKRHEDSEDSSASSSSGDSSEEERRRKRRRKEKKSKHHSRDKHRRHKHKRRRSSSSSSGADSSDSESESERRKKRKLLKDARKILREAKRSEKSEATEKAPPKQVAQITEDDYFLKNNEFAAWLKETRGIFFSDLTSGEGRRLFAKFVDEWNSGKLPDKYYEGIKAGERTGHQWHIRDEAEEAAAKEDRRLASRKREKMEQKKFQREHELVMDEILPKATGKDRLFEKKSIERQKNKARELSPEPMKESDMMGGGDDFKQMLARDRARREKRASAKAEVMHKKLSVVEERETAAMDQFRALVNTAGGKITIPKRA